ncbi:MAG: helix-turn-helix domain-containing protein, partial [Clostridiales bacterium]|nr:helix-turn-helix domain-containing protein [Clostridiales bacterium]
MFRIGEFSKLTQVSIRMLRHYDETGLLKPAKTDRFTNYRLYAADQIPILNRIIFLRDLGFNISEISAALGQWDDEYIAGLLEAKSLEIENTIKGEQGKLSRIDQAKKDIGRDRITINYNVSIKSIPAYQVLSLRRVVSDYDSEGQLWQEMAGFAAQNQIPVSSNTFSIYHDAEYKERDVDIEICAPAADIGTSAPTADIGTNAPVADIGISAPAADIEICAPAAEADIGISAPTAAAAGVPREGMSGFAYRETEPVPAVACTMAYGPFGNLKDAFLALANWLQEHNQYRMAGPSRLTVHRGPWNEERP